MAIKENNSAPANPQESRNVYQQVLEIVAELCSGGEWERGTRAEDYRFTHPLLTIIVHERYTGRFHKTAHQDGAIVYFKPCFGDEITSKVAAAQLPLLRSRFSRRIEQLLADMAIRLENYKTAQALRNTEREARTRRIDDALREFGFKDESRADWNYRGHRVFISTDDPVSFEIRFEKLSGNMVRKIVDAVEEQKNGGVNE